MGQIRTVGEIYLDGQFNLLAVIDFGDSYLLVIRLRSSKTISPSILVHEVGG